MFYQYSRPLLFVVMALPLLAANACDKAAPIIEKGKTYSRAGVAAALEGECLRTLGKRQEMVAAVNAKLASEGKTMRAIAQDCDGDGQPDF